MASRHVIVTALLLLAVASSARAAVDLSLSFGLRDEHDSGSVPPIGLTVDVGSRSWPLLPEAGVQIGFPSYSFDKTELNLGLVHYWDVSPFRFHLGGGIASLGSTLGYNADSAKGGYLHGGAAWSTGGSLSLGIDLRIVQADDFNFKGTSYPVSYKQVALLMRWRWQRDQ